MSRSTVGEERERETESVCQRPDQTGGPVGFDQHHEQTPPPPEPRTQKHECPLSLACRAPARTSWNLVRLLLPTDKN